MAITSGNYTIGTGGDYANLSTFINDIHATNVNGNITGTFISNVVNLTSLSKIIFLNGYTLTITSNVYHGGYINSAYRYVTRIIYIENGNTGHIVISNISIKCYNLSIRGFLATIKYCIVNSDTNENNFFSVNVTFYRNIFICDQTVAAFTFNLGSIAKFENNLIIAKKDIFLYNYANVTITFRNNVFYITNLTTTITKNNGNTLYGYNNTSNNSDTIDSFFNIGSNNITNVNYNNEIITFIYDNINFGKVNLLSVIIKDNGMLPTISDNNKGIRLNSAPHNGYYSIGADDFFPLVQPEKIRFTYKTVYVDICLPLYPYTSYIKMSLDRSKSTNNNVLLYDYGGSYDKRSCICKLLLNSSEVSNFNTNILNKYYNDTEDSLTIEIGTRSGFYPFGHDYGCIGPFDVKMDVLTAPKLSADFFGMFEVELKLYLCGTPPSVTFETEQSQGNVNIGTVTGLKFPQNYYQPKRNQEWVNTELQGCYNTNRIIRDMYYVETQFSLNCNISKMQRLLQYITFTNRANKYNISSDSGGYIMGYDNGTGIKTISGTLLNDELVITTNNYNDIDISLSFGSERSDIT